MKHHHHSPTAHVHAAYDQRLLGFLHRWLLANTLVAGTLALLWLLLRTGTRPSRFAYPCQQVAFSSASLAFGVPVVTALLAGRRFLARRLRTRPGLIVALLGLIVTIGTGTYLTAADETTLPALSPRLDYRAAVFCVTDCPPDPTGDHFGGLDNLLTVMGREGLKIYASDTESLLAGPDGIIAPADVVIIKINYQWPERGGTNTDLLRGLIRRLLDHPDGFTGEIVVAENTQFADNPNFDRSANNAQDITLSPHDVVTYFAGQGHTISHYDWRAIRYTSVEEYDAGNFTDGYVILPYDSSFQGRASYPKFQTDHGTLISTRYGIWNPMGHQYDRARLKFINVPVLKSHHASYGATGVVKHYMGVVTRELGTSSHNAIARGILGAVIGLIQPADLNILDCIWINANPYDGPWTEYDGALRKDMLLASTDPVALDIWSVKHVLIPGFYDEGYSPPWPQPDADPDNPDSDYRNYLDKSMNYILAAGYDCTNDLDRIDLHPWNGRGDLNCDGRVDFRDINTFVLALTDAAGYAAQFPDCVRENADCNFDGLVDMRDINAFVLLLAGG